jgi:hypothetical protein
MAKLNEQVITLKVSKLLRDTDEAQDILPQEVVAQLEQIVGELAGAGVLVEISSN